MNNYTKTITYDSNYPILNVNFFRRNARFFMALSLAIVDFASLIIASGAALYLRFAILGRPIPVEYLELTPLTLLILTIYLLGGLYAHGLGPVEELRRLTIATTVVFLSMATLSFWFRNTDAYSRGAFIIAWLFVIILVPFGREILRLIAIRQKLWGEPVVVIGFGVLGYEIANFLVNHPKSGLYPIIVVDRRRIDRDDPPRVPVIRAADIIENRELVKWFEGIQTAILVVPEISETFYELIIEERAFKFSRLIIISNAQQCSSLWVRPYDIGGILGLEVGQNLLSKWQKTLKRIVDIGLVIIASPILIPFLLVITLLIRLDSKGGIFYQQTRIGYGGKPLKMWKFRTMYQNADKKLQSFLERYPELQEEWEANYKLKKDPRVTRIGKFLRKFSLDEFPQLINVVKGEMSLVGPRPIVDEEIKFYGVCYKLYTYVLPGMTGLWQISGRSDMSYKSRVNLDEYYVRNWSIWLDIYVLSRTGLVVLGGKGSY